MANPLLDRLPGLGTRLDDGDAVLERFLDYVASLELELYGAQEEALLELLSGKNVILATPTGSGKSLVAAAMHFRAMCRDERSVYVSPIKALCNEKFFALCDAFHPDNVGLVTGDATVNPGAPILCCTAEILANMALREGAGLDVQHVVMDELHYYSDRDRGVAWQVPLLILEGATFLLMSATLGDTAFFERAMTELNGHDSVTVRSSERPVPLDFDYFEAPLYETVPHLIARGQSPIYLVSFTQKACHDEAQSLMSVEICDKARKKAIAAALEGHRFDSPYGKALQRFLRHGVGVHHGGMLPKYRRLVERLAQQGLLEVVSGTDTLGVGVNIPIRTVLLTKLCKFDGQDTRILSVRDFHQICGRAGRKGFDEQGSVVALAPAHVVENKRLEEKATAGGKRRKVVKKKPPTFGYKHWDRGTFEALVGGTPEPLRSRFRVSHGMLLDVLSRPAGGCRAMKRLIRACHEPAAQKPRLRRTAMQMFRSLVEANIITFADNPEPPPTKRLVINSELQREFSLYHTLSLFVVDTLGRLDRSLDSYPLDVLSLVEAILEDPGPILRKQLDRLKGEAVAAMKAEGLDYDERMARLDELEHPKPNKELVYGCFNQFVADHPWVGGEAIRPKGAARELYEECHDFQTFVQGYKLERSEGLVLRYLTDVYKALSQNVPRTDRTPALEDLIDYFEWVVRGVDASLIEEWERMGDPDARRPRREPEQATPEPERGITADTRGFTVLVRTAAFRLVQALGRRDYHAAAALLDAPPGAETWTAEALEEAMQPFYEDHREVRTDPGARGPDLFQLERAPHTWSVVQRLADPDEHNDWLLELRIDLERSNEAGAPRLQLLRAGA